MQVSDAFCWVVEEVDEMQVSDLTFPEHEAGLTRGGAKKAPVPSLRSFIPASLLAPMTKLAGAFLCIFSGLAAIALSTWTISDPSLTFANGGTAENWLGFWGASFADFSMQFLGFAALGLLLPPFIWGIFKLTRRPLTQLRRRAAFWIGALTLSSAALGCVSMPQGWPLEVGLGGVVGDAVLSIPRAFTGSYPGGIFASILFVLFTIPALWMLVRACNLENGFPAPQLLDAANS